MKSVRLEWALGDLKKANILLDEGLKQYPDFAKLWMMRGQILEQESRISEAREVYNQGVSHCFFCIVSTNSIIKYDLPSIICLKYLLNLPPMFLYWLYFSFSVKMCVGVSVLAYMFVCGSSQNGCLYSCLLIFN